MVVAVPPMVVANAMGIITRETGNFTRMATATRIGIIITTCGVLLKNALTTALKVIVTNSAISGLADQARPMMVATGCSAPVVSRALQTIMSAQIDTSASLPKPAKIAAGSNV